MVSANLAEGHWELHAEQPRLLTSRGERQRLGYSISPLGKGYYFNLTSGHMHAPNPPARFCVYTVCMRTMSVFPWLGEESCPQSTAQWDCWHVAKESLPFLKQSEGEENRTEWKEKQDWLEVDEEWHGAWHKNRQGKSHQVKERKGEAREDQSQNPICLSFYFSLFFPPSLVAVVEERRQTRTKPWTRTRVKKTTIYTLMALE